MQKITPFLWFDSNAEEAMNFYVSIFKNSSIGNLTRCGDTGPGPKGTVMSAAFQLDGQNFIALNGGPHFTFCLTAGHRTRPIAVSCPAMSGAGAE